MAIQTITYTDKVALNENPNVAEINKVTDDNMNEIKSVVNNNASETSTNTNDITNLKKLVPTTLYNNSSGSNGSITLSDSVSNYEYIEILFREEETGTSVYKSLKLHNPNGKNVILDMVDFHDSKLIFNTKVVAISDTTITNVRYKRYTITDSATWSPFGSNDNTIYINTVLGYK